MSVVLRKRNHRLEEVPHTSLIAASVPATLLILILVVMVVVLGHFFPAR